MWTSGRGGVIGVTQIARELVASSQVATMTVAGNSGRVIMQRVIPVEALENPLLGV